MLHRKTTGGTVPPEPGRLSSYFHLTSQLIKSLHQFKQFIDVSSLMLTKKQAFKPFKTVWLTEYVISVTNLAYTQQFSPQSAFRRGHFATTAPLESEYGPSTAIASRENRSDNGHRDSHNETPHF
ncbi:MAG: hypothetical protein HLUCCO16_16600 [Phormidium sp. OSCR]|nr:MAG: hypothetical protein HLUCCO16_16600 [Phormidium sp. OSCR]